MKVDNRADETIQELHNLLEEAIQNEDYEKAALIKAEIDRK
jgi:protein-arginine kinase activator protein McsA